MAYPSIVGGRTGGYETVRWERPLRGARESVLDDLGSGPSNFRHQKPNVAIGPKRRLATPRQIHCFAGANLLKTSKAAVQSLQYRKDRYDNISSC